MNKDADQDPKIDSQKYARPTLSRIGTVSTLTRAGSLTNSDDGTQPDTAVPFVPPGGS